MKVAKTCAVTTLLLALTGSIGSAGAAGAKQGTIFAPNGDNVTAYSVGSRGDVAPIALTTDMANPSGIARDASGRIYLANAPTNTVTVYAANANGNVAPIAVIGGSNTMLASPTRIALDANGKIYVLNDVEYRKGSITVYPPLETSTGILNEAPIATITGSKTLLDRPASIALDSDGDIYVANESGRRVGPHKRHDSGKVNVYTAGGNGNIAPIATISGIATGLAYPEGIALDSDRNIYVANLYTANTATSLKYSPSITVYAAGSDGDASPISIIAGNNTGLSNPSGIGLDSNRNLYAMGYLDNVGYSVNVYPAGSDGNVAPAATIAGADTGLDDPSGIVLDSGGSLYVLNSYGGPADSGSVNVYRAGSSGDAVPFSTMTSNFTGLDFASGITVDSTGNIYVANHLGGGEENGSIAIYPAGSYATSPPLATIAGSNTGLSNPFGIGLDSSGNIFALNSDDAI